MELKHQPSYSLMTKHILHIITLMFIFDQHLVLAMLNINITVSEPVHIWYRPTE